MLKNFQKVVEFRYKFAPPGCSPWQARNIDRLVVISFLRLMRPKSQPLLRHGRHPQRGSEVLRTGFLI